MVWTCTPSLPGRSSLVLFGSEYLNFILKFENKLAFVECKTMQELEKHKIIEIWGEKNFLEKFAWDIVEKLNKDVNLQSIAEIFV